jgi:hypothetical protein
MALGSVETRGEAILEIVGGVPLILKAKECSSGVVSGSR